ncbi:hypothetical protein GCM10011519_15040 [Marmoricola endophyticus]|uniref:Lipoprotein n=1 Tax=Marmoricola endophyticus TaxID=2040280 RepID=A0A917BGE9_9ACTN|nr:hypothetical protein [Marmoricola endophyticus]GGF42191.1 hypothetical protein GCM10011519_15040 [Marmoricola endophyticus]
MSRTRLVLAAALSSGLLLSSCATQPGTALKVGDYTLSRDTLDDVTQAQCALAGSGQGAQPTSRGAIAQSTLAVVVQSQQALRYARTHDVSVDASALSQVRTQFEDQLKGKRVSGAERDALLDIADLVNRGQLVQQQVGAKDLGLSGSAVGAAAQQATTAGAQVISAWAAKSGPDVSLDPRYNLTVDEGQLKLRDASVSEPVSAAAKQSASQQPSASYVSALPVPQRCA